MSNVKIRTFKGHNSIRADNSEKMVGYLKRGIHALGLKTIACTNGRAKHEPTHAQTETNMLPNFFKTGNIKTQKTDDQKI